ncbi:MAG: hypothetical protein M3286_03870 [Thermoproteota archaeon]|nr:hypothetical protein [Thermoproteota archaeon]
MTTPHKLTSLTGKASVPMLLLMVVGILFAAPSAMAQQIPLTPQELEQQNRLQNVIAATTRNLEQGQKQVDGIVYTPRWSSPNPVVWIEPETLSVLFVYCLPGEFAESGQQILGGSDLEVLESYSLAITNDLMVWFMIIENENENIRLPAAAGVICSSDANDAQSRVLSTGEQQEINNIIQQFITIQNTQVTNIDQVINIINNVTTNGTTTGPITPPTNDTGTQPPTNDTGTQPPTNDTGGTPTECPLGSVFNSTSGQCEFIQIFPEEPGTSPRQIVPEEGDTAGEAQGGVIEEPAEEPTEGPLSGNDTGG